MKALEVLLDLRVEEVYGRQGVELSLVDLNIQKVDAADILSPLLIKGLLAMVTYIYLLFSSSHLEIKKGRMKKNIQNFSILFPFLELYF